MVEIHGTCLDSFKPVEEAFKQNFEENLEVGASLAVTLKGKTIVDLWGGYMDAGKTRYWEEDTIVNVYSTTKVMGSLCLHMLVDRGIIDLDAPVSKYWPEYAQARKENTLVRHFLYHSSGVSHFAKKLAVTDLYDFDEMAKLLASQKPWFAPGTKVRYQSITFSFLVGELVRRVLKQNNYATHTLGEFFKKEVAEPLNIDFHIGLEEKYDSRVSNLIDSPQNAPNWLQLLFKIIAPKEAKVSLNPPPKELLKHSSTREWRAAELSSSNGHGNGRSIAQVGSILACGGKLKDKRILSAAVVENSLKEQIRTKNLFTGEVIWGLGWRLAPPTEAIGNLSFGWGGWGGSICIMDYEKQVSLGYAMNKMGPTLGGDNRVPRIAKALKNVLQTAK